MSFLSSLFSVFGGSSAKTDRGLQLEGLGDLKNIFNYAMPAGKQEFGRGQQTQETALEELGAPADYYRKLLTGNRTAALSAVAPVTNAAASQTDAQKRQLADFGTARGGGTAATGQELDTAKMSSVDNAINAARAGAAPGATAVAGATGGVGSSQLSAALNMLGLGESSAASLAGLAGASRPVSQQLHDQMAGKATDIATGILDALFA